MKRENAVLAASLLLNAGLAAFLALPAPTVPATVRMSAGDSPERAATATPDESRSVEAGATPKRTAPDDTAPATATAERAPPGNAVRDLVVELRRRGVDEGTVRRLGVAHAERLFRIEARALLAPREKLEYWRVAETYRFGELEPAKLREFQRLRRERVETLDELFGDVEAEATEHNSLNHYLYDSRGLEFAFAPPAKRLELTEYFERETAGVGRPPVQRLLWQRMASPGRDLELSEKVGEILGPDLFGTYLLESSGISQRLRYQLAAFQPTRAEFDELVRAEYQLMREQSETLASLQSADGTADPASYRKLDDARREVARDVLGDTRYADFERATDDAYRHLDQVARELGLGPSTARSAFAHVERARKQVLALSPEGVNLADPKVMDAMRKIRDETRERIAQELGLQGLNASEQHMTLGPALNLHPREISQRMFRWF